MALSLSRTAVYIPEFGGQRKEDAENPMTLTIKILGCLEFRKFVSMINESKDDMEKVTAIYAQMVEKNVIKIDNLDIEGQAITNGKELCACTEVPHDLMMELEQAPLKVSQSSDDDVKN